jgi:hypothetical protein
VKDISWNGPNFEVTTELNSAAENLQHGPNTAQTSTPSPKMLPPGSFISRRSRGSAKYRVQLIFFEGTPDANARTGMRRKLSYLTTPVEERCKQEHDGIPENGHQDESTIATVISTQV